MTASIGNKVIFLPKVDSTNNYASKFIAEKGFEHGLVIRTHEQVSGKGMLDNKWESEPHKNLSISVMLDPSFLKPSLQFEISKVAAIAVFNTVSLFVENVSIKWPNDIYVDDKKIAGILIENSMTGKKLFSSVIGIGLNINQLKFKSDALNPISLAQLLHQTFDLDEIFGLLMDQFNQVFSMLKSGQEKIDSLYSQKLYRKDIWSEYSDKKGCFEGKLIGVNEIGQLLIEKKNGEQIAYHFKEVSFIQGTDKVSN